MERDVVTVSPGDDVETVLRLLREHELPGVPVVDGDGRCVGIVTEADLVISEEEADLHLPHYIDLLGGVVFLEPLRRFEGRIHKAFASKGSGMMTSGPVTLSPHAPGEGAAGRGGHASRRARGARRRLTVPLRALARINLAAIQCNCSRLLGELGEGCA